MISPAPRPRSQPPGRAASGSASPVRRGPRQSPAAKREGADAFAASVEQVIREAQRAGATTLRAIAGALNARGVSTATGKRWEAATVADVLRRLG